MDKLFERSRPGTSGGQNRTREVQPSNGGGSGLGAVARDASEKRRNPFRFKQFAVVQERAAMKVGTDGVLLGAWAGLTGSEQRILDIGTGTGVIALMLAQRTAVYPETVTIDAVEVDPEATAEAASNFEASAWGRRLEAHCMPIQRYAEGYAAEGRYDLIVSNPPYFMAGTDFRRGFDTSATATQPSAERVAARHAEQLPYDELIEAILSLLAPHGRFAAIFPYRESGIFIAKAAARGLFVERMLEVHGAPHKPVKRVAAEFSTTRCNREDIVRGTLCIEDDKGNFTENYRELTREFYLKF